MFCVSAGVFQWVFRREFWSTVVEFTTPFSQAIMKQSTYYRQKRFCPEVFTTVCSAIEPFRHSFYIIVWTFICAIKTLRPKVNAHLDIFIHKILIKCLDSIHGACGGDCSTKNSDVVNFNLRARCQTKYWNMVNTLQLGVGGGGVEVERT